MAKTGIIQKSPEHMPFFERLYKDEVISALKKDFDYTNIMMVPKIEKVVVTMGHVEVVRNQKEIDRVKDYLQRITSQKPIITRAKIAVSSFKIRKGMALGCKVTLRRDMMYHFLWKFVNVALPRSRNFLAFSKRNFDGRGNFNAGIDDSSIFLELSNEFDMKYELGMNINVVTTAKTDAEAMKMLEYFDFPFKN